VASWQGEGQLPPLNFSLSEDFLLVRKLLLTNTKFGAKIKFRGNMGAKLKKVWASIMSHVGNLQLSARPAFFILWRRWKYRQTMMMYM